MPIPPPGIAAVLGPIVSPFLDENPVPPRQLTLEINLEILNAMNPPQALPNTNDANANNNANNNNANANANNNANADNNGAAGGAAPMDMDVDNVID
ncbi:hypothetical protein HDV05_005636, partial [Chytridiales sp. JEL 0842]